MAPENFDLRVTEGGMEKRDLVELRKYLQSSLSFLEHELEYHPESLEAIGQAIQHTINRAREKYNKPMESSYHWEANQVLDDFQDRYNQTIPKETRKHPICGTCNDDVKNSLLLPWDTTV